MELRVIERLEEIPLADWNRLAGTANPFLRHEFLQALEASGCVGGRSGWQPRHLALYDRGRLIGAAPFYLKYHSYGEYVFDWAWAEAYARAGLEYYPKLVGAVPFTPVTGPRLLLADGYATEAMQLAQGARELADELQASSVHWLFLPESQAQRLEHGGHLRRRGYQFHWHNAGYRDFEDYLAGFASDKRKKVRRERRQVREAGIELVALPGAELNDADWRRFHDFYRATARKHGATPYLSLEFFRLLGRRLPQQVLLVVARRRGEWLGAALNLLGADTLYGRYWGSDSDLPGLHFETCYYFPIEYCIERGLRGFEAGAQGEHKLARGLLPVATHSAHWLRHTEFARAVAEYLAREGRGVEYHMDELRAHAPFKRRAG